MESYVASGIIIFVVYPSQMVQLSNQWILYEFCEKLLTKNCLFLVKRNLVILNWLFILYNEIHNNILQVPRLKIFCVDVPVA